MSCVLKNQENQKITKYW